ncbi:MAG: histidinol-phosphate transaminase [Flavobacteriales bacterium]|nr:histidinol-phosphate transaminase [Flavobacteriales bacterium]
MFDLEKLIRPNIRRLQPYSSARNEFSGDAKIWLDANENPFGKGLNRYPDPYQSQLKKEIAKAKSVSTENIFLGNGSDEAIDLLIRAFCEPAKDAIITMPPTYGMYPVSAQVNNVEVKEIPLLQNFELNVKALLREVKNPRNKLTFICSPNNPTGNLIPREQIREILRAAVGIVVLDEAYIDFSPGNSLLFELEDYPNLVILQTFSKARGLAGIRLGMAFAERRIIKVLNRIKPHYNVSELTQKAALDAMRQEDQLLKAVDTIVKERKILEKKLGELECCVELYPSDANFVFGKFKNADAIYESLKNDGIIVRNRSRLLEGCLRITVGKPDENKALLIKLNQLQTKPKTNGR